MNREPAIRKNGQSPAVWLAELWPVDAGGGPGIRLTLEKCTGLRAASNFQTPAWPELRPEKIAPISKN